ncbi:hypothetical protein Q5H92_13675 [Hymenobacter sp. M29]|uniref:Uncharacterized protein n=1 Tax=Hymenobacter mellowenesis TaxID=3063995 RepID=A0ABT9ADH4_9BACT|nr:hypothetical protein [Hymenobacter sp. M29]MDO7847414.1 hypothetical protein [Hymenobacter sp. M29]
MAPSIQTRESRRPPSPAASSPTFAPNHRARVAASWCSGEKCAPRHWNPKREGVKPAPGNFAADTNLVLERYTRAAQAAYHAAEKTRQKLNKAQVSAEICRRYALLATGHRTESSFNRYLGMTEEELLAFFRKTARTVSKKSNSDAARRQPIRCLIALPRRFPFMLTKSSPKLLILLLTLLIGGGIIAAKTPTDSKQYLYISIVQVDNELMITNESGKFESVSVKATKEKNDYHFAPLFAKINAYEAQGYEVFQNNVFTIGQGTIPRNYVLMRKAK